MFEYQMHDWIAWGLTLASVAIFVVLLFVDGYQTYREDERRRQRRASRSVPHE